MSRQDPHYPETPQLVHSRQTNTQAWESLEVYWREGELGKASVLSAYPLLSDLPSSEPPCKEGGSYNSQASLLTLDPELSIQAVSRPHAPRNGLLG